MRNIQAVFQNDGEWYVARCLDFPVTTQGETLEEAKANLREAVELYLETWGDDVEGVTIKDAVLTSMEVGS